MVNTSVACTGSAGIELHKENKARRISGESLWLCFCLHMHAGTCVCLHVCTRPEINTPGTEDVLVFLLALHPRRSLIHRLKCPLYLQLNCLYGTFLF